MVKKILRICVDVLVGPAAKLQSRFECVCEGAAVVILGCTGHRHQVRRNQAAARLLELATRVIK